MLNSIRSEFWEPKSHFTWRPALLSFLSLLIITNLDRFFFGKHALVREHDWYDSMAVFWSKCYSWSDFFNFNKVNSSIVGGYDCQMHGLPPFNPVAATLASLPIDSTYVATFFLTAFICFLGIYFFTRAIELPMHWAMTSFLSFAHVYTVIGYYHVFNLDPAALILSAWILKGSDLSSRRIVPPLLLTVSVLFALSMPGAFYIPFHTLTTLLIPCFFISLARGGWRGVVKRHLFIWTVLAVLNVKSIWITLQNAGDTIRSDFYPYWGPFSVSEHFIELKNAFFSDFMIFWLALPALLIGFLLSKKVDENGSKFSLKMFYLSLFTFIIIFVTARLFAPFLNFFTRNIDPKPALLMNSWSRFYLTFHSLIFACIFCGLKQLQPRLQLKPFFSSRKQLLIFTGSIVLIFILLSKANMYGHHALALVLSSLAVGIFSLWCTSQDTAKNNLKTPAWAHWALVLSLLSFIFFERRNLTRHLELNTFSSLTAPSIEKFSQQVSNDDKQNYRAITVAIHPIYAARHGFKMADGYVTFYPLSYKKIFQRAFYPAIRQKGRIIPYFQHWGGRAYVFLPGSDEGRFQQDCRSAHKKFNMLAYVSKMRELGVRWIFSRCVLEHPEITELQKPMDDSIKYFGMTARKIILGDRLPDKNISNYIYEVKSPLPIFEQNDDSIFIRANVCWGLKKYGYINSFEKFGFSIRKNSPEWEVAKQCYPYLKNM